MLSWTSKFSTCMTRPTIMRFLLLEKGFCYVNPSCQLLTSMQHSQVLILAEKNNQYLFCNSLHSACPFCARVRRIGLWFWLLPSTCTSCSIHPSLLYFHSIPQIHQLKAGKIKCCCPGFQIEVSQPAICAPDSSSENLVVESLMHHCAENSTCLIHQWPCSRIWSILLGKDAM